VLLLLPSFLLTTPIEIEWIGFHRHQPGEFNAVGTAESTEQLRLGLEASGWFRSVVVSDDGLRRRVEVVEYPLIRSIHIEGSTVYAKSFLDDFFQLFPGGEYNRIRLAKSAEAFRERAAADGYTHLRVGSLKINESGEVRLRIEEGIVLRIEVDPPEINLRLVERFFATVLHRPFRSQNVKLALETILYSQVFLTVHAEAREEDGGVVLLLKPERRRIHSADLKMHYESTLGFELFSRFTFSGKGGGLRFRSPAVMLVVGGERTFAWSEWQGFDFRRYAGESGFHWTFRAAYDHPRRTRIHYGECRLRSEYDWRLLNGLFFTPFLDAGWEFQPESKNGSVFLEPGVGLRYQNRGPLDRYGIEAAAEYRPGWKRERERILVQMAVFRVWGGVRLRIAGLWGRRPGLGRPGEFFLSGDGRGFLLQPEYFNSEDLRLGMARIDFPIVFSIVRPGVFGQICRGGGAAFLYGAHADITIWGFPLRIQAYVREGRVHVLGGMHLTLD